MSFPSNQEPEQGTVSTENIEADERQPDSPRSETKFAQDHGFEVIYNEDGVFLKIVPGGKRPDIMDCMEYLKRKGIPDITDTQLRTFFNAGAEELLRLADPQEEKILNEEIRVKLAERNMEAYMELLPPDEQGEVLSADRLEEMLRNNFHIEFGIDRQAIDDFIKNKVYYMPVLIARGREPVRGQDAKLEYHFSLEKNNQKIFEVESDGRINFRDRSKIDSVKAGEVLVTRHPAGNGIDGSDVLGKPLIASRGKEVSLPVGKNVMVSEDKLQLIAKVGGYIEIINGKIFISPTYIVRGDIDMKVGNVDYDGDVLITGNVNAGFTVKATGNITINGVVEGAFLESGGDIILKKGMQGADSGRLQAKGNLFAQFIHRANVDVEGKICADIILHSKVKCEGDLELTAKNGLLVSGNIDVGNSLVARNIGMESGVQTKIKLGSSPKKRERYMEIGELLNDIRSNIERMDRALRSSSSKLTGAEIRMEITKKMLTMKKEQLALEKEREDLEKIIENTKEGCVHVLGKVYPGTRISIGNARYNVTSEETYVTYRNVNGMIETETCRYRSRP